MKRLLITFIMIFCVFTLASCNNTTPEDIEELTEEFCRENPEHEICKGEYIDDLQNIDVDNLFFALQYDLSAQQDVCDEYISLSNLALLDDCRQGEITFFPDGLDGYMLVNTEKSEEVNKNIYTLTLEKDARSDTIVFTITLVELDETMFIEAWEYEIVEVLFDIDATHQLFADMFDEYLLTDDLDTFCEEWMIETSIADCLSMYTTWTTEDTTAEVGETSEDLDMFYVTVKHNAAIPILYPIEYKLVKIGYSYYIDWSFTETTDVYLEFLQGFEGSFNGWALTSEEVCEMYFETGKGLEQCILRRNQRMLLDETLVLEDFEWTDEDKLEFSVLLKYINDQGYTAESVIGSLYMVGEIMYIEMILPFNISQPEQIAILDDLVDDMNDTSIDSFTIATDYLDMLSETPFMNIREYMLEESLTVTEHTVTFGSTYFDFTLSNDDHFEFEVTWEYVDGWVMHWERIYHEDELTLLDLMLHVETFINSYNTSSAGTEYICDLFLNDTTSTRCVEYETLFEDGILLDVIGVGYDEEPYTIEIGVYDSTMAELLGMMHYNMSFSVAENAIQMELLNEFLYFPLTESEEGMIIDGIVTDMSDRMLSDFDFCELYGHLFIDCMDFRSYITIDMMTVEELERTEEDGTYTLILGLYDMMMRLARELELEIEVYEDLEENTIIMGRTLSDFLVPPDEEYLDLLTAFLEAYFDETNTVDDLYNDFNDGMVFDGMNARDYVLTQGFTYVLGDITWHADTGFTWYEAEITFTRDDGDITETTLKYELFPSIDGGKTFRLLYDYIYPETSVITNYQTKFLLDLEDDALVQADFCAHYFNPWDYDNCLDFVSQFTSTGQDATAGLVSSTEFYAEFLVDFIAPDTSESQLLFDLNIVHDIKGQVHLLNTIKHPDTVLRDSFSNSVANGIVYGFNTNGINLTTFCDEFAECGTAFDDVTSTIYQVNFGGVYWSFEDYFNPELHTLIIFDYFTGPTETHKYSGTYEIDGEWYIWTLHFIEKADLE